MKIKLTDMFGILRCRTVPKRGNIGARIYRNRHSNTVASRDFANEKLIF